MHPQNHVYYNDFNLRDPPPYPGHSRNLCQPGYRQSYSGSETSTDLSLSSTENLSVSARQDPQGEETASLVHTPIDPGEIDSAYSILARLGVSSNGVEVKTTNSSTFYVTGSMSSQDSNGQEGYFEDLNFSQSLPHAVITPITKQGNSIQVYSTANTLPGNGQFTTSHSLPPGQQLIWSQPPSPYSTQGNINTQIGLLTPEHLQLLQKQSLQQHQQQQQQQQQFNQQNNNFLWMKEQRQGNLKHASSTGQQTPNQSPRYFRETRSLTPGPTPTQPRLKLPLQYASQTDEVIANPKLKQNIELRRSFEKLDKIPYTHSQPDLTRLVDMQMKPWPSAQKQLKKVTPGEQQGNKQTRQQLPATTQSQNMPNATSPTTQAKLISSQKKKVQQELDHAAVATKATEMVERLSDENRGLKQELEGYYRKVSKLQRFEFEIQKVHNDYEGLVKHSEKREKLERNYRIKLEEEVRRLRETNRELKDHCHRSVTQLQQKEIYNLSDSDVAKELASKDSMISKLLVQNKEMSTGKDRLEIESARLRNTLSEQRAHIDVLDNALSNSQYKLVTTEEELQRKNLKEKKMEELEFALVQIKMASEKREHIEQKLRKSLEEEIESLKAQLNGNNKENEKNATDITTEEESVTSVQNLLTQIQEKDKRNMELEAENLRLNQMSVEETLLRQFAVDAASMPKEARIAVLEQTSVETERLIEEATSERLKHLKEIYQVNRKCAEFEAKVKTLQAQAAEKDALISVLQKHSSLSRASSISSLFGSPLHSPQLSIISMGSGSMSGSPSMSSTSSRQNSHVDSTATFNVNKDSKQLHNRTGSAGSGTQSCKMPSTGQKETQLKDLQRKLADQAALYESLRSGSESLKTGSEQLTQHFWQV